jgi:SAM-dependent methyltransferase
MSQNEHRLYADLAWLWPCWGSVEHYRPESEFFTELIRRYGLPESQTLLDMGCGGGKNMFTLKKSFSVTGLDLSPQMLSLAKALNPECMFVEGDMRYADLKCSFDAVFINDSVTYMRSEKDLAAVFMNAYKHLVPGGILITYPDDTKESFIQNRTEFTRSQTVSNGQSLDIVFIENTYDLDIEDTEYESTFIYLIRKNGQLTIETDRHLCGLFALDKWIHLLEKTGFHVHQIPWQPPDRDLPVFAAVKPAK